MTLRQKLLLMFSLTVVGIVAGLAWTVSLRVRRVFDELNREQTAALVIQFQKEFAERASDISAVMERLATSDRLKQIAFRLANGGNSGSYLTTAATLAGEYQLDDLEVVASNGSIISSAQWPARFGYHEPAVEAAGAPAFLKKEALPDGSSEVGIFAVRMIAGSNPALYVVGGRALDASTMRDFPVPAGMQVFLYRNLNKTFEPADFSGAGQLEESAAPYQGLLEKAIATGQKANEVIFPTARRVDSVDATAIPLQGQDGRVLAVLLVANSRRGMIEVQDHIRAIAYGGAGVGILLAILASLWIAARISGPIERLASAAEQVAGGDWETRVEVRGRDELGVLSASFNHMTEQLTDQRERLVQSERVAAWRELARRLAHELKNPLFPLQITVENMVRARALPAAEFDEVFHESAATLQAEINNLKKIVGRFSDFSKLPKPETEILDARDVVRRVTALYDPALKEKQIAMRTIIGNERIAICADPELLHRALSNLVLNAMDAMPEGGVLTMTVASSGEAARFSVADSGEGLTPEECERLFTPYYTTKQHGTGLGLAIVQSVVADHHGTIAVERGENGGARFVIELPLAVEEPGNEQG